MNKKFLTLICAAASIASIASIPETSNTGINSNINANNFNQKYTNVRENVGGFSPNLALIENSTKLFNIDYWFSNGDGTAKMQNAYVPSTQKSNNPHSYPFIIRGTHLYYGFNTGENLCMSITTPAYTYFFYYSLTSANINLGSNIFVARNKTGNLPNENSNIWAVSQDTTFTAPAQGFLSGTVFMFRYTENNTSGYLLELITMQYVHGTMMSESLLAFQDNFD